MNLLLLTASQNESGGLSLPAMTIIAMLLLMLPYLIRRYTGRSVTDLLKLSVIFNGLDSLAVRLRRLILGKGKEKVDTSKGKVQPGEERKVRSGEKDSARENSELKRRAGNIKNDYLQAVSEILNFARKNRLFTILPGNVEYGGETADLTAILVTRSRVVGIAAYGFDGKIICRKGEGAWEVQDDSGSRQIGCLGAETTKQDRIVSGCLNAHGMGQIPYETVMLFTGSGVILAGDRPENAYTRETFFKAYSTQKDLSGGSLDPKETGRKINTLRAGKKK